MQATVTDLGQSQALLSEVKAALADKERVLPLYHERLHGREVAQDLLHHKGPFLLVLREDDQVTPRNRGWTVQFPDRSIQLARHEFVGT